MANEIYVESYGNDTNVGTIDAPVASIAKAIEIASSDGDIIYIGDGVFEIDYLNNMSKKDVALNFVGNGKETTILVNKCATMGKFKGNVNFYKMIIKPSNNLSDDQRGVVYTIDAFTVNYYNCVFSASDNKIYPTTFFMNTNLSDTQTNKTAYNCLFLLNKTICKTGLLTCYNCTSIKATNAFSASNIRATNCQHSVEVDDNYLLTNYDNSLYGVYSGEYAWGKKEKYFIKYQGRYYTIKEEKYNGSFYDEVTLDEINNNYDNLGFDLSELLTEVTINGETFKPIDKFEEFSIVTNQSINAFVVEGIKSNTELITANNDFPTIIRSNIDFFENQVEIVGNGMIKIAFSIDEGVTWKTHDGTDFIDLPVTIPCKPYNELTEDELIQWNNARDEILANGIDSATLKTLDFNTLTFDKIRFAYVLHIDSIEDTALNKRLIWQFDAKGSMKLMKDSEIDIEVLPTGIKVTPKIDSQMIKVNILPNGVTGSGSSSGDGSTTDTESPMTDAEIDALISNVLGSTSGSSTTDVEPPMTDAEIDDLVSDVLG